jgi:hypothetical protein
MMNFLKKLDRAATKAINQLDKDVQMPIVRAMNGEVFNHGIERQSPQKRKDMNESPFNTSNSLDNGGEIKASELGEDFSR